MDASTSRPERDTWRSSVAHSEEFAEFYLEFTPRLMRFLLVRGLTLESAQDIVQDVMVKLLDRWGQVTNIEGYAFAVARNEIIAFYRRNMRRGEVPMPANEDVDVPSHDPVAWKAETMDVLAALQHLPPRQQEVAFLYFMEDLSVIEIAQRISVSVRVVQRHLKAARNNLREQLEITS